MTTSRQIPECRRPLAIGQRVLAQFGSNEPKEGVVTAQPYSRSDTTHKIQFEPCGAHYGCHRVTPYGDTNGWTEQEYRIARESGNSWMRAQACERERQERYPDAPFSPAFRERELVAQ